LKLTLSLSFFRQTKPSTAAVPLEFFIGFLKHRPDLFKGERLLVASRHVFGCLRGSGVFHVGEVKGASYFYKYKHMPAMRQELFGERSVKIVNTLIIQIEGRVNRRGHKVMCEGSQSLSNQSA